MRNLFILLILLFTGFSVCAQRTKKKPPPPPKILTEKQMRAELQKSDCRFRYHYTPAQQRLQNYPFNSAVRIQLVSFGFLEELMDSSGKTFDRAGDGIPFENDTVNYARIKEVITLSPTQTDSLTHILYNTGYKNDTPSLTSISYGCYMPRNAIIFLDAAGKVFAWIEICFECEGFRVSGPKVKTGVFCNGKYELLRRFFKQTGLVYGVVPE
jgi:hypothetical protein